MGYNYQHIFARRVGCQHLYSSVPTYIIVISRFEGFNTYLNKCSVWRHLCQTLEVYQVLVTTSAALALAVMDVRRYARDQ
eukprot:3670764-Amphidinium_carterae.1